MSITPLRFTGVSQYSDDFQTILDRAVQIASIPVQRIQNEQADLLGKKQLLTDLRVAVDALAGTIADLGELGASKAVTATTSNATRVSVSATGTPQPGTHTVSEISSVAKAATATSLSGYATADATAVSADGVLELVAGTSKYTVDVSAEGENNLNGLRDAINALGAGVTATVLNTGTGETPYYLSLTANATGEKTFELRETAGQASSNLITNTLPAADAVFTGVSSYATAGATVVSGDGLLQLVVGGSNYSLDITGANNLNGLRDAINASGAGVTASVVNSASGATPYYVKIVSPAGAAVELRETDGETATNTLSNAHQGANAVFKLDGLAITKADNVVSDVVPDITFTIVSATTPGETVTLTLASGRGDLATSLDELVTNYNAVASELNAQIGQTAGLLSGDSIIREVQSRLRELTGYTAAGAIRSLADLGISLDDNGEMSFDSSTFYALSNSDLDAAFTFLGSSSTGLGALAGAFTQISDPFSGLIKLQQDQYDVADQRLDTQLTDLTARIELMQTALSQKLQLADTLLAQLESQQNMVDASVQSLNLLLFGKQES